MKITIERGALLKALNHVQSVVERRNTIPILANVLLTAEDGQLSLTATDLDIEIVEGVPADVAVSGGTTAPAHTMYDIVRKLPDGAQVEVNHDTETGKVTVVAGRSRFALQSLPREDFPAAAAGDLPYSFEVSAKDLFRLVEKTRFAISTEETRYYLNGIYLHTVDGKLRAVATDGHRLARVDMPLPSGADGMPGIIVPRKTVSELLKLLEAGEDNVKIAVSDTKIRFDLGNVTLTSKLIDGTFPDYGRVIPSENNKSMEVDGKLFASAVDRVSTISTERSRAVKLDLDDGKVTLAVNNPDSGSATEELGIDYQGDSLEIGFNARYLLDITQQLDGPTAHFELSDAGSPTVVRDGDDPEALYVLMPMRV
jgi:DNA polymerase-3 subunit beta